MLSVGSRAPREFSPADINLLIAVGSQISSAIDRTLLYEETRQAYDNLRRTQEQLLHSEKMAAVGQLISGVAHELNNPLTAILGYSQLLTASAQTSGRRASSTPEKLYKQAQRTHRIVQNLLSFARQHKPERVAGAAQSDSRRYPGVARLRSADEKYPRASGTRAGPAGDGSGSSPVAAGVSEHGEQRGGRHAGESRATAICGCAPDVGGDRLFVEFTDSGPGVQEPSRVFDPFYTTKPVGKGTGLGLSICYGIVTEHGGTIRVRNVQPHGASFTIELPFQAAEKTQEVSAGRSAAAAREGRILLVDRDKSVLEAVGAILRGRNHTVRTATALSDALRMLQEEEFDLIVADMQVCRTAGDMGLHPWLAANRPALALRVILMRATTPATPASEEMRGALQVLQKPFKAGDLFAAVEAALSDVHPAPIER